jgi:hypothetical protein
MVDIPALMIGTFMKRNEMEEFLGYVPSIYNKEANKTLREVCYERKYFSASKVKSLKFYHFSITEVDRLTNPKDFLFDCLRTGKNWKPEIFINYIDFISILKIINAQFPYGEMSKDVRDSYIKELDIELSSKLVRVTTSK